MPSDLMVQFANLDTNMSVGLQYLPCSVARIIM